MGRLIPVFLLPALLAPATRGELVHLDYTATAQTVVGTPFGVVVPRLTAVTGCFVYDTDAADSNGAPDRGDYVHAPGGGFIARFLGNTVTGSGQPFLQVEDLNPDTFRFTDGKDILSRAGELSFNGAPDGAYQLTLAITDGSGTAFDDDDLPPDFPFRFQGRLGDPPHTFALSDGTGGRLLLQFTSLVQIRDPELRITRVTVVDAGRNALLRWTSRSAARYALLSSTNGTDWSAVATGIASQGCSTIFTDQLSVRFPAGTPKPVLYRVVAEP